MPGPGCPIRRSRGKVGESSLRARGQRNLSVAAEPEGGDLLIAQK